MRDRGCRRVAVAAVDEHGHVIARREPPGPRPRPAPTARACPGPRKSGPADALRRPVVADRLRGGHDVRLGEGTRQARPAVARRAEDDPLTGVRQVGPRRVVGRHQVGDVDEILRLRGLPRSLDRHGRTPLARWRLGRPRRCAPPAPDHSLSGRGSRATVTRCGLGGAVGRDDGRAPRVPADRHGDPVRDSAARGRLAARARRGRRRRHVRREVHRRRAGDGGAGRRGRRR